MDDLNYLRVPRALKGLEPLALDMSEIRKTSNRLGEVALTNAQRAPELLAVFNQGYLITSRYIGMLEYEMDLAEQRLEQTRAVFMLDRLPGLLAEKGLATARAPLGSEDIRSAFIARDPECQEVVTLISNLKAHTALIKTMQIGFMNAYNSVKKLTNSDGGSNPFRPNPNLITPLMPDPRGPTSAPLADDESDFFGKPQ